MAMETESKGGVVQEETVVSVIDNISILVLVSAVVFAVVASSVEFCPKEPCRDLEVKLKSLEDQHADELRNLKSQHEIELGNLEAQHIMLKGDVSLFLENTTKSASLSEFYSTWKIEQETYLTQSKEFRICKEEKSDLEKEKKRLEEEKVEMENKQKKLLKRNVDLDNERNVLTGRNLVLDTQLSNTENILEGRTKELNECDEDKESFDTQLDDCRFKLMRCITPMDTNGIFPRENVIEDKFVHLKSNERLQVFLELLQQNSDTTSLKTLNEIFLDCYRSALGIYNDIINRLRVIYKQDDVPEAIMSCVTPFFQANFQNTAYFDVNVLAEQIISRARVERTDKMRDFVVSSLNLSWTMVLSDPQLGIGEQENVPFDTDKHERYADSPGPNNRREISFFVWPSLEKNSEAVEKAEVYFK